MSYGLVTRGSGGPSQAGSGVSQYPCDRGTGWPQGWHHFQAGPNGICCVFCGKAALA